MKWRSMGVGRAAGIAALQPSAGLPDGAEGLLNDLIDPFGREAEDPLRFFARPDRGIMARSIPV
jgi:hypothetical protein